tara:strand:+ start:797 stop:1396 length:600 start_codon:yes stop_codon:yes gene_type:complete
MSENKDAMKPHAIYTIGYGKRELDEVVSLLKSQGINWLIDVRSSPYSKFKPDFSRRPLEAALERCGIRYVFMGNLLGGRPEDEDCYVDGKVDYDQVRKIAPFKHGIERLLKAWKESYHVCLMCSEGRPEDCHRSKLIGEVLESERIPVRHIDAEGNLLSHQDVLQIINGPQASLFPISFTSRKRYRNESNGEPGDSHET